MDAMADLRYQMDAHSKMCWVFRTDDENSFIGMIKAEGFIVNPHINFLSAAELHSLADAMDQFAKTGSPTLPDPKWTPVERKALKEVLATDQHGVNLDDYAVVIGVLNDICAFCGKSDDQQFVMFKNTPENASLILTAEAWAEAVPEDEWDISGPIGNNLQTDLGTMASYFLHRMGAD